jgi:hypothetical protein
MHLKIIYLSLDFREALIERMIKGMEIKISEHRKQYLIYLNRKA